MATQNTPQAYVIGEKSRAMQQKQQMNLRKLATKTEISMLSQIETSKVYPPVRSIYSIAAALSAPVDYFFLIS